MGASKNCMFCAHPKRANGEIEGQKCNFWALWGYVKANTRGLMPNQSIGITEGNLLGKAKVVENGRKQELHVLCSS